MNFYKVSTNPGTVALKDIPVLDYDTFYDQAVSFLAKKENHCLNYFVYDTGENLWFCILIASDETHSAILFSHIQEYTVRTLRPLTAECFSMHVFEREIHEQYGITFPDHPWLKPLRYAADRHDRSSEIKDYPFYTIHGEETHEVGVGPIHAGVIEPGHFRFICHGENVLHLEIQLGYQHRGMEKLFVDNDDLVTKSVLSESVAGDSSVSHALAFSQLADKLRGATVNDALQTERILALEMERIAVHIGDTAALCGDVGYQIGQVACEALRTVVINTTQEWCGNRFGKGLVRPGGTNYPLNDAAVKIISGNLKEAVARYVKAAEMIFNNPGIISRFENTGRVTAEQAFIAGAVGMAARSAGLSRDVRASHPFQYFRSVSFNPVSGDAGDVLSRALQRKNEVISSYSLIADMLGDIQQKNYPALPRPDYSSAFNKEVLCYSIVEGWRGEICHLAVTDNTGKIVAYKIKDPSLHNWMMLALAVRGEEISDFPLCNKSFNLSYCGHDL